MVSFWDTIQVLALVVTYAAEAETAVVTKLLPLVVETSGLSCAASVVVSLCHCSDLVARRSVSSERNHSAAVENGETLTSLPISTVHLLITSRKTRLYLLPTVPG